MIKAVMIDVEKLIPYENNPRRNDNAVPYLARSIKDFGFKVPILLDKDNVIIAGHTRLLAAKQLGLKEVPCVYAEGMTEEQVKAFRLVDNQTAEFASWDTELLDLELADIEIDMSAYGFNIEKMLEDTAAEIDLGSFDDEKLRYECPCCGFRFNKEA